MVLNKRNGQWRVLNPQSPHRISWHTDKTTQKVWRGEHDHWTEQSKSSSNLRLKIWRKQKTSLLESMLFIVMNHTKVTNTLSSFREDYFHYFHQLSLCLSAVWLVITSSAVSRIQHLNVYIGSFQSKSKLMCFYG